MLPALTYRTYMDALSTKSNWMGTIQDSLPPLFSTDRGAYPR